MPDPIAPPPPMLDYAPQRRTTVRRDRMFVFCSGVVFGLVGLCIAVITIGVCVQTWPSFGMTLIAVPIELVAFAFIAVGVTAIRAAVN